MFYCVLFFDILLFDPNLLSIFLRLSLLEMEHWSEHVATYGVKIEFKNFTTCICMYFYLK